MADDSDAPETPSIRFDEAGRRFEDADGASIAAPLPEGAELARTAAPKVGKTNARAAVALRISGADYAEIARVLDYVSPASARMVVEETLANAFPDESRESLRRLTGARMEGLMKKIAPKTEQTVPVLDEFGQPVREKGQILREANPEQLAHIKTMADLISRHARIMGVDQSDITISPTNEQYSAMMRALRANQPGAAKEADPFADSEEYIDAEVVEDIEDGELDDA